MTTTFLNIGSTRVACRCTGPEDGPAIVFAHALGTSMTVWDAVIPYLPAGLRVIRYDLRGHGQSSVPKPPYTMGALVTEAAAISDALAVRDALFVGLSVGGMIAQGLAVKRPDLIRALVLSNTAAKIGNPNLWQDRIATVQAKGMVTLADSVMPRWFGRDFLKAGDVIPWRDMLRTMNPDGYTGVCSAIAGTDFYTTTAGLRIPTLGIAGSEDKSTPADLVRETIDLIPGSQFTLIRRAGHLPCVEQPEVYAGHLRDFMQATGHMAV